MMVLVALDEAPLDSIRLMKAFFIAREESDRSIDGFISCEPSLSAPRAFDLYPTLPELEGAGVIAQPGDTVPLARAE